MGGSNLDQFVWWWLEAIGAVVGVIAVLAGLLVVLIP